MPPKNTMLGKELRSLWECVPLALSWTTVTTHREFVLFPQRPRKRIVAKEGSPLRRYLRPYSWREFLSNAGSRISRLSYALLLALDD